MYDICTYYIFTCTAELQYLQNLNRCRQSENSPTTYWPVTMMQKYHAVSYHYLASTNSESITTLTLSILRSNVCHKEYHILINQLVPEGYWPLQMHISETSQLNIQTFGMRNGRIPLKIFLIITPFNRSCNNKAYSNKIYLLD